MKKKLLVAILIVICLIIVLYLMLFKLDNHVWITDNEFLYDKVIQYLIDETAKNSYDREKEGYKVFTEYEGYGIEIKNDKKYAYMWILLETHYMEDGEIRTSGGISAPYKILFKDNKVI